MRKSCCLLTVFLLLISLTGCCIFCSESRSKEIGMDGKCKIEYEVDTHQGLLGDGEYFARMKCNSVKFNELVPGWKELPLSQEITDAIESKWCDTSICANAYERYSIPNITSGYYYFEDRHPDSKDRFDDTNLNDRPSYNFTLGILDKNTGIIYYYKLDTDCIFSFFIILKIMI